MEFWDVVTAVVVGMLVWQVVRALGIILLGFLVTLFGG